MDAVNIFSSFTG